MAPECTIVGKQAEEWFEKHVREFKQSEMHFDWDLK